MNVEIMDTQGGCLSSKDGKIIECFVFKHFYILLMKLPFLVLYNHKQYYQKISLRYFYIWFIN